MFSWTVYVDCAKNSVLIWRLLFIYLQPRRFTTVQSEMSILIVVNVVACPPFCFPFSALNFYYPWCTCTKNSHLDLDLSSQSLKVIVMATFLQEHITWLFEHLHVLHENSLRSDNAFRGRSFAYDTFSEKRHHCLFCSTETASFFIQDAVAHLDICHPHRLDTTTQAKIKNEIKNVHKDFTIVRWICDEAFSWLDCMRLWISIKENLPIFFPQVVTSTRLLFTLQSHLFGKPSNHLHRFLNPFLMYQ